MVNTDRLDSLYSPVDGFRVEAEWDDHGEVYPHSFEGPDVWVSVTVPEGIHRVSLYDSNKDGHENDNRLRDFSIDLLPYRGSIADAAELAPLAHARIRDFWNGCYTSFVVRGPSKYYLHVAKNTSIDTLVAGVFVDKQLGPVTPYDKMPMPFMGIIRYEPPSLDTESQSVSAKTPAIIAVCSLWSALNAAQTNTGDIAFLTPYRLFALRSAQASGGSDALLKNWRWHLNIWQGVDRETFLNYMRAAHGTLGMTVDDPRLHPDD